MKMEVKKMNKKIIISGLATSLSLLGSNYYIPENIHASEIKSQNIDSWDDIVVFDNEWLA